MRLDVYHHFSEDQGVLRRLDAIQTSLNRIEQKERVLMIKMQNILDAATEETTVVRAIGDTVDGLVQQLKDLVASGATQAEMQAALDTIQANKANLQQAVIRGTPAAPAGTPTEPPVAVA